MGPKYENMNYDFVYTEGKPETVVFLRNMNSISSLLFPNPIDNIFAWLGNRDDPQQMKVKQHIQFQLREPFHFFESFESAYRDLGEKEGHQKAILVADIKMLQYKSILKKLSKVKKLFFYSKTRDLYQKYLNDSRKDQGQGQDPQEEKNEEGKNIFTDTGDLIKELTKYKELAHSFHILPNFVFPSRRLYAKARTLQCLLKQRIDQNTQNQINLRLKEFIDLLRKRDKNFQHQIYDEFFQFLQNRKSSQENQKKIISFYVKQSFIYKIVNNLFRAYQHPAQLFYIQPYVKMLFNTIKELYKKQSQEWRKKYEKKPRKFIVYRGGQITPEEIQMFQKNKGRVTQNLGFLSSSLSQSTAQQFKKNLFIQIQVQQLQVGSSQFGFLDVKAYGLEKYDQEEVLFNPMNRFRIMGVSQGGQGEEGEVYYKIFLRYQQQSKPTEQQRQTGQLHNIISVLQGQKYQNQCQGNALTNECYDLKGRDLYWYKYLKIVRKQSACLLDKKAKFYDKVLFKLRQIYGEFNKALSKLIHHRDTRNPIQNIKFLRPLERKLTNFFGHQHSLLKKLKKQFQDAYFKVKISKQKIFLKQCRYLLVNKIYLQLSQKHQKMGTVDPMSKDGFLLPQNKYNKALMKKIQKAYLQLFMKVQKKDQKNMQRKEQKKPSISKMEEPDLQLLSKEQEKALFGQMQKYYQELLQKNQQKQKKERKGLISQMQKTQLQKLQKQPQFMFLETVVIERNLFQEYQKYFASTFREINDDKFTGKAVQEEQLIKINDKDNYQYSRKAMKLAEIPKEVFLKSSLSSLDLSDNKIKEISDDIQKLSCLTWLKLSKNAITTISDNISVLNGLISLNLDNNKLSCIPIGVCRLPKLLKLFLVKNQIKIIPQEIAELSSLRELYLESNKIEQIKEGLFKVKSLKKLNLSGNRIKKLSPAIGNLLKLKQLKISVNNLQDLPAELFKLSQLTDLNVQKNYIEKIDDMSLLTGLKNLYLSNNLLVQIPKGLNKLKKVEILQLANNKIEEITNQIYGLKQLTRLDLACNKLTQIPQGIQNLGLLNILDISKNQINCLPKGISSLAKLQQLYFQNNKLTEFPEGLDKLVKLKRVFSRFNLIKQFPPKFAQLGILKIAAPANNRFNKKPRHYQKKKIFEQKKKAQNEQKAENEQKQPVNEQKQEQQEQYDQTN